jgi:hypothetical protein
MDDLCPVFFFRSDSVKEEDSTKAKVMPRSIFDADWTIHTMLQKALKKER